MRFPRPKLSVRALMLLVLVLGGGFGWVVHRAHLQRDAVAAIKRSGGSVAYSWDWEDGLPLRGPRKPPGPLWLRRLFGPDFFDTVTHVRLQGPKCGDEALSAACSMPWLKELKVIDTSVTDAGAEELWRLSRLRILDFRLNWTSPKPLRHIGGMTDLRDLQLAMRRSPVPFRDEDVAFLRRLTRLESLMLPGSELSGSCLVYIKDLQALKTLYLLDARLNSDDLRHLRHLTKLSVLSLHGTRITSVENLSPLSDLTTLYVAYTPIGNDGLASLSSWPKLVYLDVRKTEVTDKMLTEIRVSRPALTVNR